MASALVSRLHRPSLAIAFSLLLLLAPVLSPAYAQQEPPQDQDPIGLAAISAEYHDLVDLFYRPVDPPTLLQAAWAALAADASRRGAPAPAALPPLPNDPDAALAAFAAAYTAYMASSPIPPALAAADIQMALADSLHEQHTHYLSPGIMRSFLSTVGGGQQSVGLGVRLGSSPPGLVTDVAPGGPADTAGIQPGDVIVAADGKDLSRVDAPSLTAALAGADGSTVQLGIDRGAGSQPVTLTRGPYYFPPLESSVLPGGVGYLKLTSFVIAGTPLPDGSEVLSDLDRRLDDLDAQGAQSLILDLRNNGGGSVQTADEILGRFLPDTARSVRESDERGHLTFELASGRVHARQLPMVVLVNGGSASASEITAASLREAGRALLVGQRTAGALASSELLPLPGGGGLQVAIAAATTADTNTIVDGVGIAPDVVSSKTRSLDDYRSGRDPQIEAAITALASAPTPPSVSPQAPPVSATELDQLLAGILPNAQEVPTNDRLTATPIWQRLDYTHPNEVIDQNGGASDPLALQQALISRGYEGSVMASYGAMPGDLPTVSVNVDLYATAAGAHQAAISDDLPQIQVPINAPLQLGDETVAYRGAWWATGATVVVWRRGRVVFSVTYSDVPGFDRPDTLVAVSQLVDRRAQAVSLPYVP